MFMTDNASPLFNTCMDMLMLVSVGFIKELEPYQEIALCGTM